MNTSDLPADILRERADALARVHDAGDASDERIDVVEFLLGRERYALPLHTVREVEPLHDFTPVPCTPPWVLGLINVRGEILTVIDLRRLFGIGVQGLSELNRVIILSVGGMEVGILADDIAGTHDLSLRTLAPPLPSLGGLHADYVRGVTADGLTVLETSRLLADDAVLVNDDIAP